MPSTVAIVGASMDRSKFGNRAVRAYAQQGWKVYPVHPQARSIEGHPAYPSVLDVPLGRIDRVSLYVPPAVGLELLSDIATKLSGELWLNPGAESPELVQRAEALGLNVIAACSIVAIGVDPEG